MPAMAVLHMPLNELFGAGGAVLGLVAVTIAVVMDYRTRASALERCERALAGANALVESLHAELAKWRGLFQTARLVLRQYNHDITEDGQVVSVSDGQAAQQGAKRNEEWMYESLRTLFTLDEMENLVFGMDIPLPPNEDKDTRARRVVEAARNRGLLNELCSRIQKERPLAK